MLHVVVVLLVMFFLPGPMYAHHGTAAYDTEKSLTLKGVVMSFEFINPHAEIRVAVTDENGRTVNWLAETNNPNRLARRGWNRNLLKTGDVITIVGNPVKSGAPNLRLTKVVLADGRELDPLLGCIHEKATRTDRPFRYVPVHFGGRLFRNASMPSRKSLLM